MSWMVMIYGFETEELAEQCRREVQVMYFKWAAKQDEDEDQGAGGNHENRNRNTGKTQRNN